MRLERLKHFDGVLMCFCFVVECKTNIFVVNQWIPYYLPFNIPNLLLVHNSLRVLHDSTKFPIIRKGQRQKKKRDIIKW